MGLLNRLFGGGAAASGKTGSSQFHESESTARHDTSVNGPRRELVHVVLRDTMRKHGVPSDWLECRMLSVVTRQRKAGMHVHFIVKQGGGQIVDHIHAFQQTFWRELEKFEPRARDWLFSLAWQFDTDVSRDAGAPARQGWDVDTQPPEADTQPPDEDEEVLRSDLQALYAIRDAALSGPADAAQRPPRTPPRERNGS